MGILLCTFVILLLGGESKWFQMFLNRRACNMKCLEVLNSHSGSAVELLEEMEAVRGQERDVGDHSARGVSGPEDRDGQSAVMSHQYLGISSVIAVTYSTVKSSLLYLPS